MNVLLIEVHPLIATAVLAVVIFGALAVIVRIFESKR